MFSRVHFYAYEITAIFSFCINCISFNFQEDVPHCYQSCNPEHDSLNRGVNLTGSPKADELGSACHPRGSVAVQGLSPLLSVGAQERCLLLLSEKLDCCAPSTE